MKLTASEELILYALDIGALGLTPACRTLKSGRMSPHFFNSGLFCTGRSLKLLGRTYASRILDSAIKPEVIFGPAYKGISIAAAVAQELSALTENDVGWAHDRKKKKKHGEKGLTVGFPMNGKKVLIVDDVVTSGESSRKAFATVSEHGGIPVGFMFAFDREERSAGSALSAAQELRAEHNIPVCAAATLTDLIGVLERGHAPDKGWALPLIFEYQREYGVA